MYRILVALLFSNLLLFSSACSTVPSDSNNVDVTRIYLVRHAEKTKARPDPDLTQDGKLRALELVEVLKNAQLTNVHSSDTIRTKETARPSAELFNLDIEIYDPRNLSLMADKLKVLSGQHLVVGHSNTTPQLVELLGGDSVSEINEASEYDRLYIISFTQEGAVQSELLRYGNLYIE